MYTNLNKININCNKMKYIKLLFLVICHGNISKFSYNFPKNTFFFFKATKTNNTITKTLTKIVLKNIKVTIKVKLTIQL